MLEKVKDTFIKIMSQHSNKYKNIVVQRDNAYKIETMYPIAIFNDMQHNFALQKDNDLSQTNQIPMLESYLTHTDDCWAHYINYKQYNPQNQVLLHAMAYKKLIEIYKKHLDKPFEKCGIMTQPTSKDIPVLSAQEYKNLPKRYRGAFRKYNDNLYILSAPYKSMRISSTFLESIYVVKLLQQAEQLVSKIYRETDNPDIDFGGMKIYEGNNKPHPAFVKDSFDSMFVTNEQFNTIKELHSVFVEISRFTMPCAVYIPSKESVHTNAPVSGAWGIYDEYEKEQKRKGTYLRSREKLQPHLDTYKKEHAKIISELKENLENIK